MLIVVFILWWYRGTYWIQPIIFSFELIYIPSLFTQGPICGWYLFYLNQSTHNFQYLKTLSKHDYTEAPRSLDLVHQKWSPQNFNLRTSMWLTIIFAFFLVKIFMPLIFSPSMIILIFLWGEKFVGFSFQTLNIWWCDLQ